MSRPTVFHPTSRKVYSFQFVYVLVVLSLIALACNTFTRVFDTPVGDSPSPSPVGISGPTRPVGFVNHGTIVAVVMPWTFVPLGSDIPFPPPDVSTVSTVISSPGLWPNPSRFLSLPFGTYTWCFEWEEGDLDNDSYADYFHFYDDRPVTVDEDSPDDHDFAIQVDFSAPPAGTEILSGPCGSAISESTHAPDNPTNTPPGVVTSSPELTITPSPTPDPTDVAYVGEFDGTWNTNWGEMTCTTNGSNVHCEYTHDQGRIDATLSADGRTMEGQWAESPSYSPPNDGGRVTFTLSDDGNSIDGLWWYGQDGGGGDWTGTRE